MISQGQTPHAETSNSFQTQEVVNYACYLFIYLFINLKNSSSSHIFSLTWENK